MQQQQRKERGRRERRRGTHSASSWRLSSALLEAWPACCCSLSLSRSRSLSWLERSVNCPCESFNRSRSALSCSRKLRRSSAASASSAWSFATTPGAGALLPSLTLGLGPRERWTSIARAAASSSVFIAVVWSASRRAALKTLSITSLRIGEPAPDLGRGAEVRLRAGAAGIGASAAGAAAGAPALRRERAFAASFLAASRADSSCAFSASRWWSCAIKSMIFDDSRATSCSAPAPLPDSSPVA